MNYRLLWEFMGYGAFCLGGGILVGWVWWGHKAPKRGKSKHGPLYGRGGR